MTDQPSSHEIGVDGTAPGYDNETILLEEDDVEAHGMLGVCAAVVVMAGTAGGAFLSQAGTALAPEPARLTQSLSDSMAASAAAVYVNTSVRTTVLRWPSSYSYAPYLAAGTPCSTYALPPGAETAKVIQATGNYRRCV